MDRLSLPAASELLANAGTRSFAAGEVLVAQGEESRHVFVLRARLTDRSACVKVTATLKNGGEGLLGIRVPGDLIGELAALRNGVRGATVTACTPILAHSMTREAFLAFLNRYPRAWEALSQMIADRLDWANRRRLDFSAYEAPVRLARVLLELVDLHGSPRDGGFELGVRLSQDELGKLIGAKPDTVTAAVRQLRARGLIETQYRSLIILDVAALTDFSDPS